MTMKLAPIRLRSYFLTDLHLQVRAKFDPNADTGWKEDDFQVEQKVERADSTSEGIGQVWQIDLTIRHQPAAEDNFPYAFRLSLVGFIEEASGLAKLDETARERIVRINGTSILYGAAREIVRAATGRGPHAPVLLPTVSFWDPPPSGRENAAPKPKRIGRTKAAKPKEQPSGQP